MLGWKLIETNVCLLYSKISLNIRFPTVLDNSREGHISTMSHVPSLRHSQGWCLHRGSRDRHQQRDFPWACSLAASARTLPGPRECQQRSEAAREWTSATWGPSKACSFWIPQLRYGSCRGWYGWTLSSTQWDDPHMGCKNFQEEMKNATTTIPSLQKRCGSRNLGVVCWWRWRDELQSLLELCPTGKYGSTMTTPTPSFHCCRECRDLIRRMVCVSLGRCPVAGDASSNACSSNSLSHCLFFPANAQLWSTIYTEKQQSGFNTHTDSVTTNFWDTCIILILVNVHPGDIPHERSAILYFWEHLHRCYYIDISWRHSPQEVRHTTFLRPSPPLLLHWHLCRAVVARGHAWKRVKESPMFL